MSGVATIVMLLFCAGPSEAERLDRSGREAYVAKDYAAATRHWLEADRLQPTWERALNLARAYYLLEEDERCWHWAETAGERGMTTAKRSDEEARAKMLTACGSTLRRDHALLVLEFVPRDRVPQVSLDGQPWDAPHRRWVTTHQSRLRVEWDGQSLVDESWTHAPGDEYRRTVAVPAVRPLRPTVPAEPDSARQRLRTAKWTTLGIGLVLGGVGAGLYGHSFTLTDEINQLNASTDLATDDQAAYLRRYDDLTTKQDSLYQAGVSMLAIGGASLVTSIVLFSVDATMDVTPVVQAGPAGGSLTLMGAF